MSWALPQAWSTRQFCTMSGNRVFARSVSFVLTPRTRLPRFVLMTPPCGVTVPKLLGSSNENVAEKPLPYCLVEGKPFQPTSPVSLAFGPKNELAGDE